MNSGSFKHKWRNLVAEARLAYPKKPGAALIIYKAAIMDCRTQCGPNSSELAELFDEAGHICFTLGENDESKKYRSKAEQIRVFNSQFKSPFRTQVNPLF